MHGMVSKLRLNMYWIEAFASAFASAVPTSVAIALGQFLRGCSNL